MDEKVQKVIEEMVCKLKGMCKEIERSGYGTENYMQGSATEEVFFLTLKLYLLYIATADGELNQKEVDMFNTILGENVSLQELKELAMKTGVNKDDYADQVPVIIRCFIDYDNDTIFTDDLIEGSQGSSQGSVSAIYELYFVLAALMVAADDSFSSDEYYRMMRYLGTIYNTIVNELDTDYAGVEEPHKKIRSSISSLLKPTTLDEFEATAEKEAIENREQREKLACKSAIDEQTEKMLNELMTELDALVGLDEVKYEVTSLINLCRIKQIRESKGLSFPPLSLHLVFSGNPGTGKTTVARMLAKIYKQIGVLSKGHLVEVDRSGLVGGFVGQTAIKVQEVIESALGGVLFIDEAYALTRSSSDNDYGYEAVDILVKAMEDHRDDLVVVVAGYTEPMSDFIQSNPGLKSRFNKFIIFNDYSPKELVHVFNKFCKKAGYRASVDALRYVEEYFEKRCGENPKDFGNAREARNLFEQAMMRQANRIVLISNPGVQALTLIKREDVSGEVREFGKSEQMAKLALDNLKQKGRMGLPGELMECELDELELAARAISLLAKNDIKTLGDMVDMLEAGKKLTDLSGMNDVIVKGIYQKLVDYGFTGDTELLAEK